MKEIYESANHAKADFDDIYNLPDPRRYYSTLGALDYRIPTEAKPVFRRVIEHIGVEKPTIVDVGCSYGVNAALIQYDLDFADLVKRYQSPEMASRPVAETLVEDAAFFAGQDKAVEAAFTGLDLAEKALSYAQSVGLIDDAIAADLERRPLAEEIAKPVAGADLIITTGAVGYVTERTFSRLVDRVDGPPPWVAAFSLRQFPFDAIADELAGFGLETQKLEGRLFPQRRFRDEEEQAGAVAAVEALGLDPAGLEAAGEYFAEFYLAAPKGAPGLEALGL